MNDYDHIFIEIGSKGNFSEGDRKKAAQAFRLGRLHYPTVAIGFFVGGYDTDPREIYDIPEAREYIRLWAMDAGLGDWRTAIKIPWDPDSSLGILQLCGVFGPDSPIKCNTPSGVRTA